MRKLTYSYLLTAVVFSFVASGAYAAAAKSEPPTAADVEACWAKADADPSKENSCLKLDLAYAQSEYKTVTEQVASLAKAWDIAPVSCRGFFTSDSRPLPILITLMIITGINYSA